MSALTRNDWRSLRQYTAARIGSGRAGSALPTAANLQFQLDHARARDAVLQALDVASLCEALSPLGLPVACARSRATDRGVYLQRPDLGRQLDPADRERLAGERGAADIGIVIADGLSSLAVQAHAAKLLHEMLPLLRDAGFSLAPLVVAQQGRVALGDEVGAALGAKLVLVLIGERPGLSSPDSLGVYLTFAPQPGRLDSERNCISNIRPPAGLDYASAAQTCLYLCRNALQRGLSGVKLKDDTQTLEHRSGGEIPFLKAR